MLKGCVATFFLYHDIVRGGVEIFLKALLCMLHALKFPSVSLALNHCACSVGFYPKWHLKETCNSSWCKCWFYQVNGLQYLTSLSSLLVINDRSLNILLMMVHHCSCLPDIRSTTILRVRLYMFWTLRQMQESCDQRSSFLHFFFN